MNGSLLTLGALGLTAMPDVATLILAETNNHPASGYPPLISGLRGNHKGSFEVAHQLAHGYCYPGSDLYDEVDVDDMAELARKPFGNINIAN